MSSMPYARHHINPVCSKAVALLRAYRKRHKKLALPSLEKLSMRIDGELFKMTKDDDGQVTVRVTIRPHEYEYVRFRPRHKKWAAYSQGRLGEITLTDGRLLLTFVDGLASKPLGDQLVGVDLNFATVDCTPIDREARSPRHDIDEQHRAHTGLVLEKTEAAPAPRQEPAEARQEAGRDEREAEAPDQGRPAQTDHGPSEELPRRHIRLRGPEAHQEQAHRREEVQDAPEPLAVPDGADDGRLQVAEGDVVPNSERDFFEMSRMRWKDRAPNSDPVRHTLEGQRVSNMRRGLRQEPAGLAWP